MSLSLSAHQQIRRTAAPPAPRPASQASLKTAAVVGFFAAHVLLGVLARRSNLVAVLHALATAGLGVWWAAVSPRRMVRVACVGAYIVGAEVLWRMTRTPLPWEFGKYALSAVFLVALVRRGRAKVPPLPLLFFALLLVSVPLTIENAYSFHTAGLISFNLSGPFALLCSAWFFSHLKLSNVDLQRMFMALIAPVVSVSVIALTAVMAAGEIGFSNESNRAMSGGFGPNQVSAVMGLGAFLALLFLLKNKAGRGLKALVFLLTILLAAQSALTFSRGGLYTALGATLIAAFYLARSRQTRVHLVLTAAVLFAVANFVVLPRLDAFTGGALLARFQSTKLTGRDNILRNELQLWLENPFLGVGPGMAQYYRDPLWVASHTEYSRLLAEHGLFGLTSLALLLAAVWRNFARVRTNLNKAVIASFSGWSLLFMSNAGMRLAAPAFMLGLTFTTLLPDVNAKRGFSPSPRRIGARGPFVFGYRRATTGPHKV